MNFTKRPLTKFLATNYPNTSINVYDMTNCVVSADVERIFKSGCMWEHILGGMVREDGDDLLNQKISIAEAYVLSPQNREHDYLAVVTKHGVKFFVPPSNQEINVTQDATLTAYAAYRVMAILEGYAKSGVDEYKVDVLPIIHHRPLEKAA